jgi:methylenetetrahydrofolate reductase (NADPH)
VDRTPQGVLPRLERVGELLRDPKFELVPLKNALDEARHLPPGATVTVTASPGRGIEPSVALSEELADRGFRVVPHLSARLVRDRAHLDEVTARLRDARIRRAFVVGGDGQAGGAYPDALSLLEALAACGSPFEEIGIAGYPGGHPTIPEVDLRRALVAKAPFASYITTQLCFDAAAIVRWIASVRAAGIELPVHLGVAGAVDLPKLVAVSARIGVGDSLRYLRKNAGLVGSLLRRNHTPDRLLRALAPALDDPAVGVERLHLFTFNQVAATERWRRAVVS